MRLDVQHSAIMQAYARGRNCEFQQKTLKNLHGASGSLTGSKSIQTSLFGGDSGGIGAEVFGGGFGPATHVEFFVDVHQMSADGGVADEQARGDFLVRAAFGDERED